VTVRRRCAGAVAFERNGHDLTAGSESDVAGLRTGIGGRKEIWTFANEPPPIGKVGDPGTPSVNLELVKPTITLTVVGGLIGDLEEDGRRVTALGATVPKSQEVNDNLRALKVFTSRTA